MPKKKAATSSAKVKEILVNVVLDRSGSMSIVQKSTINGYNEYLNGLRADKESTYNITLIQFDTGGPDAEGMLTVSYVDKPLADAPNLNEETYQPRGGTPLYDAIGECVRRVEPKGRGVFTVIITDGEENSSREFTRDAIKKLITSKEAEGWKFVFLGANIDAMAVGGSLGVSAATTASYTSTPVGVSNTFGAMASSNLRYAASARTSGLRSASVACSFTEAERSAMVSSDPVVTTTTTTVTGGRPAAPPTFPATKRRSWKANK